MSGANEAVTALVFDARQAQQGAQQFQRAGQQVIQANAQVTQSTQRTADSQTSLTRAVERMTRQLDPAAAAAAKLSRDQDMLDRAHQRGLISAERYTRNLQLLQERHDRVAASAQRGMAANDNLSRALQQGQQAAQGFASRLGPLGAVLTGLGPAGLAAAAGLGAITLGMGAAVRAATEFETLGLRTQAIIRATGGAAGLTAQQIRDMSQSIARDTLASTAGVEAAAARLLTFRSVAGDTFERTLRAAQDLAATGFGSIESAAVQLGKALENPAQGLSALSRSGVTFSSSQREVIQRLVETGEAAEAQRLILEAVERQVGGAGAAQAGGLAGAYDSLGQNVQEFLVRLGNLGPLQAATAAINTLAGAVGLLDAALARLSGTDMPVVVARRTMDGANAAVAAVREQAAALAANQPAAARRGSTGAQAAFIAQGQVGAQGAPDLQAALAAAVEAHAVAQAAFVAAVEESQREQTEAAVRGIEERQRAEREAAAEALRTMRAAADQRIGVEQAYQTRLSTIRRAERAGLIDAAEAAREVAAATVDRDRALARLDQTSRGAARATRQQTDAERDLAREIERGVALVQQTQTEQEKYAQQLNQLSAALQAGRVSQEQFNRAVAELDPAQKAAREAAQRATREAEQLARRQEQEAERTVDRITDFFGKSFARAFESTGGGFRSLMDSMRRAAISTFASIAAQAVIRPIIAPIVGAVGGGGLGSLLGMGGGGATGAAGATGGFSLSLDQIMSGVGLGRLANSAGLFGGGAGGGLFGGLGGSVSEFLGRPLFNAPFGGSPSFNSADFIGSTLGAPVSIGQTLGALGGIAGGAFGIYSGIQKGGIGGAFMGAGGVAGIGAGLATLTGIGASLAPILGPLAIALPLIGMLLPGQRPSSRMQGVMSAFAADEPTPIGFDGAKFSPENRAIADQFAVSLRNQERILADLVGFRAAGGFDLRVGDERGDGPAIEFRIGGRNYENTQRFGKDEAGLRALSEYASQQLFLAFQETAETLGTDMARIVRGSANMEQLTANAEWFRTSYEALSGTMVRTSELGNALIALQAPFTDAIAKAREFGLSIDGLVRNLDRSVQEFLVRNLRQAEGRQYIDAMEGIVVARGTAQVALDGRDGAAQLSAIAGRQLRALFEGLTPTQLLDALANTGDLQAKIIAQQVLDEMRAGAIIQQRDVMDRAQGRDVMVQAREIIRAFDQIAPQLAALGQNELAWDSLRAQVRGFMSDLSIEQLEMLTAFDDLANKLSDDVIRAAAEAALAQRRAAEAQAQAARDIERVLATGGSIRAFIDARRGTASPGGASPMDALAEAQRQFGRDLSLAREGDVDALQRITGTADRLLNAGSAAYASGPQFQALREMTLTSLENLPVTRSYDAMILEAIQALGGSVDVAVQVEMIRAITEQLNALPAADRAQLIQSQDILRPIYETLGRSLTAAERASLTQGQMVVRSVEDRLGRTLTAQEQAALVAPASVIRGIEDRLQRSLTPAEQQMLVSPGVIVRAIEDQLRRTLTAAERASLVSSEQVLRAIEQSISRNLTAAERASLLQSQVITRQVGEALGRRLTAAETASLAQGGGVLRIVQEQLGRNLTAAERAALIEAGSVDRGVFERLMQSLTPAERAALVQAGTVSRSVQETLGARLTAAQIASLLQSENIIRRIEQFIGQNLTAAQRATLLASETILRPIEQRIGRALTQAEIASIVQGGDITRTVAQIVAAATGQPLIPAGTIRRDVLQNVETTETVQISRSIDDKLSGVMQKIDFNTQATHSVLVLMAQSLNALVNVGVLGQGPNGGLLVAARRDAHLTATQWVKFAEGGMVRGGQPGVDSVRALMMPGEGVLSLRGMSALGEMALNTLNAGRAPVAANNDTRELVRELRELRAEVNSLRRERASTAAVLVDASRRTASNTGRAATASERTADGTERLARDAAPPVGRRGAA